MNMAFVILITAPFYGNLIYFGYRRYDRPEQLIIRWEIDTIK